MREEGKKFFFAVAPKTGEVRGFPEKDVKRIKSVGDPKGEITPSQDARPRDPWELDVGGRVKPKKAIG